MKKIFALAVVGIWMAASAWAGEATIGGMVGEGFIAKKEGIERATPGMTCEAGDMLMTRAGCHLELTMNGQAGCRMLPNTTMAIASVRPEKTKLLVAEGNVVLSLAKLAPAATFTLDTPTSIASVRGTQFWGRVAGTEGQTVSTFAVKEGVVQVTQKSSGQTVELKAGQAIDLGVAASPTPLQPRPATDQELQAMKIADLIAFDVKN